MPDELAIVFDRAFKQFCSEERSGIQNGVNERNLCGRLGIYLQSAAERSALRGYYADPEYNRKQQGKVKTIMNRKMKVVVVNCDLILHSRGEIVERDNLIAIEMKKSDRPQKDKDEDRERLMALTKSSYDNVWSYDGKTLPEHVCGYELGMYIELDRRSFTYILEEYRGGALVSSKSGKLLKVATPAAR